MPFYLAFSYWDIAQKKKKNIENWSLLGLDSIFLWFFTPSTDCPLYFGRGKGSVLRAVLSDVSRRSILKKEPLDVKIKEGKKTDQKWERDFSLTDFEGAGIQVESFCVYDNGIYLIRL